MTVAKDIITSLKQFTRDLESGVNITKKYRCTKFALTKDDYWPCICVERDFTTERWKKKRHRPGTKRCRDCRTKRPEDWIETIVRKRKEQ